LTRARDEIDPPCEFADLSDVEGRRRSFETNGFYVVRQALPLAKVAALREDIERVFSIHARPGEDVHRTCARLDAEDKDLLYLIFQTVSKSLALDALKLEGLPRARELYAAKAFISPDMCILFALPRGDKRLAYGWHQEQAYMPGLKDIVNFWFPIFEPATRENGTMSVLAGSHTQGILPYTKSRVATNAYLSLVPKEIDRITASHREYHCVAAPGDLVVFHATLIHRSNTNTTDRTRFTGACKVMPVNEIPPRYVYPPDAL
jgi:ectoine hydroxylase-related dioxygenase (phytanoyl-CoA dioxygenase family)